MRLLSPRLHGAMDYLFVAAFVIAPWALSLGGLPATICDVLAAVQLTLALCTAYPAAVARAIPFAAHGWIELFSGVLTALAPWIFGFAGAAVARDFFMATGALMLLSWVATEYRTPGAARAG